MSSAQAGFAFFGRRKGTSIHLHGKYNKDEKDWLHTEPKFLSDSVELLSSTRITVHLQEARDILEIVVLHKNVSRKIMEMESRHMHTACCSKESRCNTRCSLLAKTTLHPAR